MAAQLASTFARGAAVRVARRAPVARTAARAAVVASRDDEFVMTPFRERRALKVIAGLKNFDADRVAAVVRAAEAGGATHVDIACDPELVRLAASLTALPICVSAVEPALFVDAVRAGAHMIELGNYDPFYTTGRTFSAAEVLALTVATRALLPGTPLSVTVPHKLLMDEQVALAAALEAAGADIIQTEGGMCAAPGSAGVLGLIEKAAPTLAAAYAIGGAVSIPVMCASGLSHVTAPMAIAAGAAGVGVGSAVNKLNDPIAMIAAVRAVREAMEASASKTADAAAHVPVARLRQ